MPLIKKLEYEEEEGTSKPKKKKSSKAKSKRKATAKATSSATAPSKSSISGIIFVIVFVVLLGGTIIYTSGKVSQVEKGGDEKAALLSAQVESLKNELKTLRDATQDLEEQSASSKEIVIDLFDKNREIPKDVDTTSWLEYQNSDHRFILQHPQGWEVVDDAVNVNPFAPQPTVEPTAEATDEAADDSTEEVDTVPNDFEVYFQPIADPSFAQAITLKNDYTNFSELTIAEKYDIFKGLDLLDEKDFAQGKMLYFIDLGDDNQTIPTILILTDKAIYRATFTVANKALDKYVDYRLDFEEIISTFELLPPVEPAPIAEPAQ